VEALVAHLSTGWPILDLEVPHPTQSDALHDRGHHRVGEITKLSQLCVRELLSTSNKSDATDAVDNHGYLRKSRLAKAAIGYAAGFTLCPTRDSFVTRQRLKGAVDLDFSAVQTAPANSAAWESSPHRFATCKVAGDVLALMTNKVQMESAFGGVAWTAQIDVSSRSFHWIGFLGHWIYVGCFEEKGPHTEPRYGK
jgi:hypothetical protein